MEGANISNPFPEFREVGRFDSKHPTGNTGRKPLPPQRQTFCLEEAHMLSRMWALSFIHSLISSFKGVNACLEHFPNLCDTPIP